MNSIHDGGTTTDDVSSCTGLNIRRAYLYLGRVGTVNLYLNMNIVRVDIHIYSYTNTLYVNKMIKAFTLSLSLRNRHLPDKSL